MDRLPHVCIPCVLRHEYLAVFVLSGRRDEGYARLDLHSQHVNATYLISSYAETSDLSARLAALAAIHSLIFVYTAHSRDLTISSYPFVNPSSPPLPYVQERRASTPSSAVSQPSEAQHWTASWATEFMYSNSYNVPAARIQGMCTESIFRIVSTSLLVGTRVPRPGERAAVPILLEAFPIPPPSFLFTRFRFRLRTILRIPDSTLRAPMRPREDAGH